jgi:hypothetical protein
MTTKKGNRLNRSSEGASFPEPVHNRYARTLLFLIEKKLLTAGDKPVFIQPERLAKAIRENPGTPLPPIIHAYLCDYLEGKIARPRGRKSLDLPTKVMQRALAKAYYEKYFAWLQKRQQRLGKELKGWGFKGDWWQGPPHERAARMTLERLGKLTPFAWPYLLNLISSD